jgi:penicillin-binding protein 1A
LQAVPSIALGSSAVSPLEITQAYSTFMREGKRLDAYLVQRVENARGDVLYVRPTYEPKDVYDPELSHMMTGMMARVVQAGTGTGARLPDREAAGKTGTSSDWRDAWFIGYTADFTTGVWVGYDDNSEMQHVSGATIPSAIWRSYMMAASRGLPARHLPGYDLPPRPERDFQFATFYDALTKVFGFGDDRKDEPKDIMR